MWQDNPQLWDILSLTVNRFWRGVQSSLFEWNHDNTCVCDSKETNWYKWICYKLRNVALVPEWSMLLKSFKIGQIQWNQSKGLKKSRVFLFWIYAPPSSETWSATISICISMEFLVMTNNHVPISDKGVLVMGLQKMVFWSANVTSIHCNHFHTPNKFVDDQKATLQPFISFCSWRAFDCSLWCTIKTFSIRQPGALN